MRSPRSYKFRIKRLCATGAWRKFGCCASSIRALKPQMTDNTAERWQEIERLYHAALDYAPAQRDSFLDNACAGDQSLRLEVESLLAYQDQSEGFIESSALEVAAKLVAEDQIPTVTIGQTINQYQITSQL